MKARRMSAVAISSTVVAGAALVPGAASAAEWSFGLDDWENLQISNKGRITAKFADSGRIKSTVAPVGTITLKGSSQGLYKAGKLKAPDTLTVQDKITFDGAGISVASAGTGGFTVSGGLTKKTFTWKRSGKKALNFGHAFSGLQVRGTILRVTHQVTTTARTGSSDSDVTATDTCRFADCHF